MAPHGHVHEVFGNEDDVVGREEEEEEEEGAAYDFFP
jgi:hypothetical protein